MIAEIEAETISLKPVKGDTYDGIYKIMQDVIDGRDGKIYVQFDGGFSDCQSDFMVDDTLMSVGSVGSIQIRARGEAFFNSVFVFHDGNQ